MKNVNKLSSLIKFLFTLILLGHYFIGNSQQWEISASGGYRYQTELTSYINNEQWVTDYDQKYSTRLSITKYLNSNWKLTLGLGYQHSNQYNNILAIYTEYKYPELSFSERSIVDSLRMKNHKILTSISIHRKILKWANVYSGFGLSINTHRFIHGSIYSNRHFYETNLKDMVSPVSMNLFYQTGVQLNIPINDQFSAISLLEYANHFNDRIIQDILEIRHFNLVGEIGIAYSFNKKP
jgi:hypothetical protein